MNPDIAAPGERVRLDLEPQLRGPPGPRRALAPREPEDGRRGRHRGALRRHQGVGMKAVSVIEGGVSVLDRNDVDTDQIIPKQFLKRVERTGLRRVPLLRLGQGARLGPAARTRSWPPGATSAAARRASTRPGRSRTTASRRSSRRASRTSSTRTAPRSGCCRWCSPRTRCGRVMAAGHARDRPRRADGELGRRRGLVRDRPRDEAPPARGPRRHRRDAPAGATRSTATRPSASAPARSRPTLA